MTDKQSPAEGYRYGDERLLDQGVIVMLLRLIMCVFCCALVVGGCAEKECDVADQAAVVQPPRPPVKEFTRAYMADNAILKDPSICELHFVPGTDKLSGLGVERLNRMADLLGVYGGTVYYNTGSNDQEAIGRRVAAIRDYLSGIGADSNIAVEAGLARGRGVDAKEAIEKQSSSASMQALGGVTTGTSQ